MYVRTHVLVVTVYAIGIHRSRAFYRCRWSRWSNRPDNEHHSAGRLLPLGPQAEQARPWLPTHNVFATVRVLNDRHSCHSVSGDNFGSTWTAVLRVLWPNTEQPRSTAPHHWVAEHRSARPRSGSGVLLLFLLIQTSTHHSLNQQHRLADDQPEAARHELSEHRLLSSITGSRGAGSNRS